MIRGEVDNHIVATDGSNPKYPFMGFACLNCGKNEPVKLPVRVTGFLKLGRAFAAKHKNCKDNDIISTTKSSDA